MISNERQYRISKGQAERLRKALSLRKETQKQETDQLDPDLLKAEEEALRSQLSELECEILQYEELCKGQTPVLEESSIGGLPRTLIRARIAAGLSQKELAERLGLKEQQIQRYESTQYSTASLNRLKEVVKALGIDLRHEAVLPSVDKASVQQVVRRLEEVGVSQEFIRNRILPSSFEKKQDLKHTLPFILADRLSHIYGWSLSVVLGNSPLRMSNAPLGAAHLKVHSRPDEKKLTAYAVYAHYLALLIFEASKDLTPHPIPQKAHQFMQEVVSRYGALTLKHVLMYAWDLGISVLPLADSGAFHAACWRIQGRNVIVLKQRTQSNARWLFDLLHEIWHAATEPEKRDRTNVEIDNVTVDPKSPEELRANEFAGQVMLNDRAEELAEECVEAASGKVEFLKRAVRKVAESSDMPCDFLANYMAYRLGLQGINWWGTAASLHRDVVSPFDIARTMLFERVDLSCLTDGDRELVLQAMR